MKNKKKKVKEKDKNVIEETVDTQENEEELAPNRFDEFVDGVIEKKDSVKPKGKKTIVLALVSIILFALTFALQSIYTNYLAPVGENEIVNWMFVTGSKNADVANAETYNQASKDNRIRKPIFDRYVHTVYNIDSSKDERVLSVITEYAPVKITLNDQEIYNNGYGKKKIVGNSYNEVLIPSSTQMQKLDLYIYYPFGFNLKADINPVGNSSMFDASNIADNFQVVLGLSIALLGLVLCILVFGLMFRSRDILVLVGVAVNVLVCGAAMFFKEFASHNASFSSPLFFAVTNVLTALVICLIINNFNSLVEKKNRFITVLSVFIVTLSAVTFVPNVLVMQIGLIVSAICSLVAFIILFNEFKKTENLFILGSSAIRIVGIYSLLAYMFNAFGVALGAVKYSVFVFIISTVITLVTLFILYSKKIAMGNLVEYSSEKGEEYYTDLFKSVADIIIVTDNKISYENYVLNFCNKTYTFLTSNNMLAMANYVSYSVGVKKDDMFDTVYSKNAKGNVNFNSVYSVLNTQESKFSVGTTFFNMLLQSDGHDDYIVTFENLYIPKEFNITAFIEILYQTITNSLANYKNDLIEEQEINPIIYDDYEAAFIKIAQIVEAKCLCTENHIRNVSKISAALAIEMGLEDKAKVLAKAAMLHDIGKIVISNDILRKPGNLTNEEINILRQHIVTGYNILSGIDGEFFAIARAVVLEHHENYDGTGYLGRRGDNINLYARIVKVADVFDALVSKRDYKEAWNYEDAINYIFEKSGSEFDPRVVAAFSRCGMDIIAIEEDNQ